MNQLTKNLRHALLPLLAIASLSMVACKKNDNSAPAPVPVAVQPNWTNCPTCTTNIGQGMPGLVGVRSSTTNENVLFAFDIVVAQQVSQVNWADPKAILYYNGPASLQGALRIVAPNDIMVCNALPGDYEIRPLTTSMIASGGGLSHGTFEALGANGSRIVFRVGTSMLYNSQDPGGVRQGSQTNRLQLNLILDFVNNQPCGSLATR